MVIQSGTRAVPIMVDDHSAAVEERISKYAGGKTLPASNMTLDQYSYTIVIVVSI